MKALAIALGLIFYQFAYGQSIETVQFESKWKKKTIELKAELRIPRDAKTPSPLVIIQHSSGPDIRLSSFKGYTDNIGLAVGEAAFSNGYAVLYTDTFTARNIAKDSTGDIGVGVGVAVRDIKAILKILSNDIRIDKSRIFLFGHSYGGGVALESSYDATWGKKNPFRAIVISAPGCQIIENSIISTPAKLFVGEKDDYVSPQKCVTLVNDLRRRMSNIEIEIVKDVIHSYSYSGTWLPSGISRTGCPNSEVRRNADGLVTIDGVPATEKEIKDKCIKYGRTAGGNGEKLGYLAEKTLKFFQTHR